MAMASLVVVTVIVVCAGEGNCKPAAAAQATRGNTNLELYLPTPCLSVNQDGLVRGSTPAHLRQQAIAIEEGLGNQLTSKTSSP
ncbi:hypothetical protein [Thermostichus sp. MS-CIW-40]